MACILTSYLFKLLGSHSTFCDYKASLKGGLKRHMKSVHDRIKYRCEYCDYKAPDKVNLQRYVKSIPDGVTYSCEYYDHKATMGISSALGPRLLVKFTVYPLIKLGLVW